MNTELQTRNETPAPGENQLRFDRLIERYKDSNPDFYRAYKVARLIVDVGGGHGNGGIPPTPPKP